MTVKELMTAEVTCCTPDTRLQDVAKLMCDHDCGEIPVVDNLATMRVIGVVTDRDITCRTIANGKNPLQLRAKDCMSSPAVTVTPETSIDDCCRMMETNQIRRMPVVDGSRACRGIVSQADFARHVSERLAAELLCEISRPRDSRAMS